MTFASVLKLVARLKLVVGATDKRKQTIDIVRRRSNADAGHDQIESWRLVRVSGTRHDRYASWGLRPIEPPLWEFGADTFDIINTRTVRELDRTLRRWRRFDTHVMQQRLARYLINRHATDRSGGDERIGDLTIWNDEYAFAWITAYPRDAASAMAHMRAEAGSDADDIRQTAIASITRFMTPGTHERYQLVINPRTRRPFWRLDYIEGMSSRAAALVRHAYCARNITMDGMAAEIARFRLDWYPRYMRSMTRVDSLPRRTWWRIDVYARAERGESLH